VTVDISILIPDLRIGGAEKVVVDLANFWVRIGLRVEVVVLYDRGELRNLLAHSVNYTSLNVSRLRNVPKHLASYLRNRRPKILWVHLWPLTALAIIGWLISFRQCKIFLSNHNMQTHAYTRDSLFRLLILRSLMPLTYRRANGITAVSQGVGREVEKICLLKSGSVNVIYNPVGEIPSGSDTLYGNLWGPEENLRILTVGELKRQKNHALLVEAISKIKDILPVKCVLVGDGELRGELERQITRLSLGDIVQLVGYSGEPEKWYATADVFILTSDWEGFSVVLVEALSAGLKVISTNCQSGPAEILDNGRYGTLVDVGNCDGLAKAILETKSKKACPNRLKDRASDFEIQKISTQYLTLFGIEAIAYGS
jgi:glycosyltransferase involved in cell wall biosynthesis